MSEASIRAATRSALEAATERGFRSIAFPLIGAGTGGRSQSLSFDTLSNELDRRTFDGDVVLVCWSDA
jgi:O-acetyl-ADP-ribose deacetylase (regulator of RNase III)